MAKSVWTQQASIPPLDDSHLQAPGTRANMNTTSQQNPASSTTPPAGKFVTVRGKRLHYHDQGAGEPLLLLQGGGPGASGWSNYQRNIGPLSKRYRVITPDLPGYGQSEPPDRPEQLFGLYAQTMLELLKALELPSAHVVGNSLGGGTAIKMALLAPQAVNRLILMGPGGLEPAWTPMPTEGIRRLLAYYAGEGPSREKLRSFLEIMIYDPSALTDAMLETRYQASIAPAIVANPPVGRSGKAPVEALGQEDLGSISHETLILWGRDDRVIPFDCAHTLMSRLPNARLTVFAHCGHWVQWEKARAFNATVESFLREGETATTA